MSQLVYAMLLTTGAGLATALGGFMAVFPGWRDRRWLLPGGLGLSAGVMTYVSFVELLPAGREHLGARGPIWGTVAFFAGMLLIGAIDRLVPEPINPHEPAGAGGRDLARTRALLRTGALTATALAIHNFPEGFATLISGLEAPTLAAPIAVAVAIHNIPEGLAVAVPVYGATGSPTKAVGWAALSGAAEPAGALLGFLFLRPFIDDTLLGVVLCVVAGIMVFICLDELLPSAERDGQHHVAMYGVVVGMAVMAVSLQLLG